MSPAADSWQPVCAADELPASQVRVVNGPGVTVAVVNAGGVIYDRCSHDGSALFGCGLEAAEILAGAQVICPRHGARFCLKTGTALSSPANEPLATFRTQVARGMVGVMIDI